MRQTKLILIEGIPGSGKSTTAQFVARQLAANGIAAKWWYEEEAGHPVYAFRDGESLQRLVADLGGGHHRRVIAAALRQWHRFAAGVRASGEVVVADGCLFGYLTWSLFPFSVPAEEIAAYVAVVGRIIAPAEPCVISLYQDNIVASLGHLARDRGEEQGRRYIERSTQTPYGQARGLHGLAGMVAYWAAYREVIDAIFARLPFPKLAIENGAGDWSAYERRVLDFLDLPQREEYTVPPERLARYTGTYRDRERCGEICALGLAGDSLHLDGAPGAWPRTRLIPLAPDRFAVASLPFEVSFAPDPAGAIVRMRLSGPPLLFEPALAREYARDESGQETADKEERR